MSKPEWKTFIIEFIEPRQDIIGVTVQPGSDPAPLIGKLLLMHGDKSVTVCITERERGLL